MKNIGIMYQNGIYYSDLDSWDFKDNPVVKHIPESKDIDSATLSNQMKKFMWCSTELTEFLKDVECIYIADMTKKEDAGTIIKLVTGILCAEMLHRYGTMNNIIQFCDIHRINDLHYNNKRIGDMKFDDDKNISFCKMVMYGLKLHHKVSQENRS